MTSSGEMCVSIKNFKCTYTLSDSVNYISNINRRKRSKLPTSRCLFGNISDSNNNINHKDYADKLLDAQFNVDRERFINRFNFDICESKFTVPVVVDQDYDMISENIKHRSNKVIRLDENVNIEYFCHEESSKDITAEDRINLTSLPLADDDLSERKSTSPVSCTRSKINVIDSRTSPYSYKKQSHLTDFWKMKRGSCDLTKKRIFASSSLLKQTPSDKNKQCL